MITPKQIVAGRALVEMSQYALAKMIGISRFALSKIENGVSDPRVSTLQKIEHALESQGVVFDHGPEESVKLGTRIMRAKIAKKEPPQ